MDSKLDQVELDFSEESYDWNKEVTIKEISFTTACGDSIVP